MKNTHLCARTFSVCVRECVATFVTLTLFVFNPVFSFFFLCIFLLCIIIHIVSACVCLCLCEWTACVRVCPHVCICLYRISLCIWVSPGAPASHEPSGHVLQWNRTLQLATGLSYCIASIYVCVSVCARERQR